MKIIIYPAMITYHQICDTPNERLIVRIFQIWIVTQVEGGVII